MAGGVERTLRRRIRGVQSTRKITRAFELIAASQIVRSQNRIRANRSYREGMARIVLEAARNETGGRHLIGTPEDPRRVGVVVIVGDRGLSGPYNSSVLRATEALLAEHRRRDAEVRLLTIGRKAVAYFRFRGRDAAETYIGFSDRPAFTDARRVAAEVWRSFRDKEVDLVQLVSTRYRSAGSQRVEVRQLLPLPAPEAPADEPVRTGYTEFEPDPETLIALLMPKAVESEIFSALLEASASEHAARQRAMAAATDNADELVRTLSRIMNRARQDAITTEIMEIVGGAEALRREQEAI